MDARFVAPETIRTIGALLKRSGAEIESEIQGSSMGATLPAGARVRIACSADPQYRVGQVVAYLWANALIAHRIVARGRSARSRGYFLMRGDGRRLCDPAVPADTVLGLVTAWRDGDQWSPLAAPPRAGWLRRVSLIMAQLELELHPDLGRHVAAVASSVYRRLRPTRGS